MAGPQVAGQSRELVLKLNITANDDGAFAKEAERLEIKLGGGG